MNIIKLSILEALIHRSIREAESNDTISELIGVLETSHRVALEYREKIKEQEEGDE
jgi:hypothetical protein